MYEDRP